MKHAPVAVGEVYNDWTVVAEVPREYGVDHKWVCKCSCGVQREVYQDNLRTGKSKSCGVGHYSSWNRSHGRARDPLMGAWRNMLSRCTNPRNRQFHDYGGRGITVHPAWASFQAFDADVGPHPGRGYTLDRINNEGNYEPGNVRWAPWSMQARNRRNNVLVTFQGRSQCLTDWAKEVGVTGCHLYRRHKKGMTFEQAIEDVLKHPPKVKGKYKTKSET